MKGFNSKFTSFDYIRGITHEIWEEKQVETLHHYYSEDIVVRSPSSVVIGNKAVIDATYATLDEFPDRQLLGEDVIWSGNPDAGMLSSRGDIVNGYPSERWHLWQSVWKDVEISRHC